MVLLIDVVNVVGGQHLYVVLPSPLQQHLVDGVLVVDVVVLNLDVVVVPEDVQVLLKLLPGRLLALVQNHLRHLALQAAGGGHEALVVLAEEVKVDARLVVEALQEGGRGELHQVLVAGLVFRQENLVIASRVGLVLNAARRQVKLAPNDWLDVGLLGRGVELRNAVEIAVVGNGDGRNVAALGALDEVVDAGGAVEQGVLRVAVEVGKVGHTSAGRQGGRFRGGEALGPVPN